MSINIRPIEPKDADRILELTERNRELLLPYFPISSSEVTDKESAAKYVTAKQEQAKSKQLYCFMVVHDQQLVGCSIIKNIEWKVPKCELAYWVDRDSTGQGIASEAVRLTTEHCFKDLGMEKVFLRIDPGNPGSIGVAKKNDFVQEGHLHNEFRMGTGELIDLLYFAKLKDE